MAELTETGVIDAVTYFEHRHGRRAFGAKNASQVALGDASYNPFKDPSLIAKPIVRSAASEHSVASSAAASSSPSVLAEASRPPPRRPRGPGTAFAEHINQHGFPADASRRSASVDGRAEALYHYDPNVLHTHKRVRQLPFRSKQCDDNVQLFLRPEEAAARAEAQRQFLLLQRRQSYPRSFEGLSEKDVDNSMYDAARRPQGHRFFSPSLLKESPRDLEVSSWVGGPPTPDNTPEACGRSFTAEDIATPSVVQVHDRLALLEVLYAKECAKLQEQWPMTRHDDDEQNTRATSQVSAAPRVAERHRRPRRVTEGLGETATLLPEQVFPDSRRRTQRAVQPWEQLEKDGEDSSGDEWDSRDSAATSPTSSAMSQKTNSSSDASRSGECAAVKTAEWKYDEEESSQRCTSVRAVQSHYKKLQTPHCPPECRNRPPRGLGDTAEAVGMLERGNAPATPPSTFGVPAWQRTDYRDPLLRERQRCQSQHRTPPAFSYDSPRRRERTPPHPSRAETTEGRGNATTAVTAASAVSGVPYAWYITSGTQPRTSALGPTNCSPPQPKSVVLQHEEFRQSQQRQRYSGPQLANAASTGSSLPPTPVETAASSQAEERSGAVSMPHSATAAVPVGQSLLDICAAQRSLSLVCGSPSTKMPRRPSPTPRPAQRAASQQAPQTLRDVYRALNGSL